MTDIVARAAEALERHVTEQANEAGCTLACGYAGDDLPTHLAQALQDAGLLADPAKPLLDRESVRTQIIKAYTAGMNRYNSGKANVPSEVQKVEEYTDAVMELARPVPTREDVHAQIAKAYAAGMNRYNSGKINPPTEVQKVDEYTDAVMKLLNDRT
jgi:hypothetical protein